MNSQYRPAGHVDGLRVLWRLSAVRRVCAAERDQDRFPQPVPGNVSPVMRRSVDDAPVIVAVKAFRHRFGMAFGHIPAGRSGRIAVFVVQPYAHPAADIVPDAAGRSVPGRAVMRKIP